MMNFNKEGLHPVTRRILDSLSTLFCKVEPHDPADAESPDLLWLSFTDDEDAMSEGDLIKISQSGSSSWFACHDFADKCGGWPTVWSKGGSEEEIRAAVVKYLQSK